MMRSVTKTFLFVVFPLFFILSAIPQIDRPAYGATADGDAGKNGTGLIHTVAEIRRSLLTDHDGDGLSDGLQERLARLAPSVPVDIVVTFITRGHAVAARKALGPFGLQREFAIIPGFAATVTAAQARALSRAEGVFRVEEDFQVTALLDAARPAFGVTAVESWNAGLDGGGLGICVVDTGVDPGHEQLNNGKVAGFFDFVAGKQYPYDDHGHGTHVSAIAAGQGSGGGSAAAYHGVAPAAAIYAGKVLDGSGSGYNSDVVAGVDWCASQPEVSIISMSLGSVGTSDGGDALSQAVDAAVAEHGKVVVVAAGNSGDGFYTVGSPGAAALAITVGAAAEYSAGEASHHSQGIYLAPFSSRGPTADERIKPDIIAPGVSIKSASAGTVSGYAVWSGTSMATPFVSGALALALQTDPELTPAGLKNLLLSTAADRGEPGKDNDWGAGLLDVAGLVAAAGSMAADPTPFPRSERNLMSVPDNGQATFDFEITAADLGIPVAVGVTILDGDRICLYGSPIYCDLLGGWAWAPDLDAEIIHPARGAIALSECPLNGECGSVGRQETLHFLPLAAEDVGTYTIRIWPFADDSDGGLGGEVAIDLSRGPLPTTGENTPPVAYDQNVSVEENSSIGILLAGYDADGDPLSFAVADPPVHGALSGSAPTLTYTPDSDYTGADGFTFTVHDGLAASDPATVTVNVTSVVDLPPTVTIDSPADGATFDSGSKITFSGTASDPEDGDLTADLLWVSDLDGVIGTGGSFAMRGKKKLRDGIHVISAEVDDSRGQAGSDSIQVIVASADPAPDPSGTTMHILNLVGSPEVVNAKFWKVAVAASVRDNEGNPVAEATVYGEWGGGYAGSASCLTDGAGTCTLTTRSLKQNGVGVTFTVTDVTHGTLQYAAADDVVTSVEVSAP